MTTQQKQPKKKAENYAEWATDKIELEALGYRVDSYSKFHHRVFIPDTNIAVDVWPAKRKYMIVDSYESRVYENIVTVIGDIHISFT